MITKDNLSLTQELSRRAVLFEAQSELDLFLDELVSLVADHTKADLVAFFLFNHLTGELEYKAGIDNGGFIEEHAGDPAKLRFGLDENIAGRAFTEDRILQDEQSKLVVPIRRGSEKIGVLVLAHRREGFFSADLIRSLHEASSQIGSMLESSSVFLRASEAKPRQPGVIKGQSASKGIGQGKALVFESSAEEPDISDSKEMSVPESLEQFDRSLERSIRQVEKLQQSTETTTSEMVSILFTTHLLILKDDNFTGKMRELIDGGMPAARAVASVVNEYAQVFSHMAETRFAEKAQDVRDLGYRLIKNLSGGNEDEFNLRGQIAIVEHIFPSDLFRLSIENIAGVVLLGANLTAHIAILAGSLSLPVVITEDRSVLEIENGTDLLLDGTRGLLYVRPTPDIVQSVKGRLSDSPSAAQAPAIIKKGATKDGVEIRVAATVNILRDAEEAVRQHADGIGLYRSEFPFIINNDFLTDDQQYKIYRKIVQTVGDGPVTLRTADIGGDKLMQGRESKESNPFLGVRGIRFSLANRELFREQLRAFLRAGYGADLRIMLPMVSGVEEVIMAKEEIALCAQRLTIDGIPHNNAPQVGAMVELPSAAMAIDVLAEETDFLSIGTNDLTMYLLAVDRTNKNLSHLFREHHPTVLRTIAQIAKDTGDKIANLSVCGESTTDPVLVPFFIGLGIRSLSVTPRAIQKVRSYIARFSLESATSIAKELLSIKKIQDMDLYLQEFEKLYSPELLS